MAWPCWIALLVLHEAGHMLHAWLSGGIVNELHIPVFGFSHTNLSSNPSPRFVAWGGAIWGTALPAGVAIMSWLRSWRGNRFMAAFAGLCALANGMYLASAAVTPIGDAEDLVRLGTPRPIVIGVGIVLIGVAIVFGRMSLAESPGASEPDGSRENDRDNY